ncbi:hypothetical protein ACFST9_17075 [Hymenobacter monticola]|uniref:Uncharacterized protein n=1 Tax=Hymenobacter monticola TaxID=1705399 RepID=A0ABY4B0P0_9BACT|nr:hypothetical protein [Hymenobacter monticola]UOE32379.1 hypothetical protein MTP16_14705 [Hymenobacter monticola]
MSTNRILAFGAVALLLYLGFAYGLRAAFPCTEVGYNVALTGRITGVVEIKGQRTFFLNGQRARRYDFDAFGPAAGLHRANPTPEDGSLSRYLRKGDLIRKPGRAVELTVQRGDSLTRWGCAPARASR